MIEDNQKEKWRMYNTSREFSKDLKFNRKWYHLIAIFDQDRGEDFDFNNDIEPGEEFDFNQVIEPIIYSSEDFVNTDEIEFDFNSPLMEKYKITEIGLIMGKLNEEQRFKISNTEQYPVENIVKGNFIKNIYNQISEKQNVGFYIKTALDIFDKNGNDTLGSIIDPNLADAIFQTILKSGAGYANEATIQLLRTLNNTTPENNSNKNIINILSQLEIFDLKNKNTFPDTIYKDSDEIIPIDLKVAKEGIINYASSNNRYYMNGIYKTLLAAINSNKTNPNLMEYIKETKLIQDGESKKLTSKSYILPELKGFLLISSVEYKNDNENYRLEYSDISIRSMISCLSPIGRGNWKNNKEIFFANKGTSTLGDGDVKYDNGCKEIYKEDGILKDAPLRFAVVVKNFFTALYNEVFKNEVNEFNIASLAKYINIDPVIDKDNIEKIYNAINRKNEENLTEK